MPTRLRPESAPTGRASVTGAASRHESSICVAGPLGREEAVAAKGSPHAHFQRAVERRSVLAATAAAEQLGDLSVADALSLCLLYAETDDPRFARAAARWHSLFVRETPGLEASESALVLASVTALAGPARVEAARLLGEIARRHRVPNIEAALGRVVSAE